MDEATFVRRGIGGAGGAPGRTGRAARVVWLALAAACGTVAEGGDFSPGPPSAGIDGGRAESPEDAVARFLGAVARDDHAAMARHFGTRDGPFGETGGGVGCALRRLGSWVGIGDRCPTRAEIETRMALVARILAHDSYRIGGSAGVVGRGTTARRILVELADAAGRAVAVPFVVVKAGGGWLVEEVGLGAIS